MRWPLPATGFRKGIMKRELVEEYRAKAQAERARANGTAAHGAWELADSYDRLADAYDSLLAAQQKHGAPVSGARSA